MNFTLIINQPVIAVLIVFLSPTSPGGSWGTQVGGQEGAHAEDMNCCGDAPPWHPGESTWRVRLGGDSLSSIAGEAPQVVSHPLLCHGIALLRFHLVLVGFLTSP